MEPWQKCCIPKIISLSKYILKIQKRSDALLKSVVYTIILKLNPAKN